MEDYIERREKDEAPMQVESALEDNERREMEQEPMQVDNVREDHNQGREEAQEPMEMDSVPEDDKQEPMQQEDAREEDMESGEEIALWDEIKNYPDVVSSNSSNSTEVNNIVWGSMASGAEGVKVLCSVQALGLS